jgi:molybdopterin synthase sulfur carrier subunit
MPPMAVTLRIPTALRGLTRGRDALRAEAATVGALLDAVEPANPGLRERVLDARGVRRFINVYVNDEDVRFLGGLDTALQDGDEVTIVPAIAGGA